MRNVDIQLVCQQHDPDIWHEEEHEAKAVGLCLSCPALGPCLDVGTDPANRAWTAHGVWGGMNHHKRDRIRAGRARGEELRYQNVTFTTTDCRTPVRELSS